jgi:hypothetical protein
VGRMEAIVRKLDEGIWLLEVDPNTFIKKCVV